MLYILENFPLLTYLYFERALPFQRLHCYNSKQRFRFVCASVPYT